MFKNIIWDFDGTLFDTYSAQTSLLSKIVLDEYNLTITKETIRAFTTNSFDFALKEIANIVNVEFEEIKNHFISSYPLVSLDDEFPYTYAYELCSMVRNSGGKNMINTHRGKERLFLLLRYYNMFELFSDIITADDDFPRKPDPTSFNTLIDRNGLNVGETLVIGDRELDILGGQNAGLQTYFFNSNNLDIEKVKSDFMGDNLEGVVQLKRGCSLTPRTTPKSYLWGYELRPSPKLPLTV
ncbi:MAG: HAD-IA family hydrolase [Spirochaetales bacterium]|nr:HAD-IA family hydrolase [Spirochaetales bacterium]